MKKYIIKNLKYIIILLLIIIVCCLFISKKEGFHEDEMFSYGSSNFFYDNVFRSYGKADAPTHFISNNILNKNFFYNLKYYLIDHRDEIDPTIKEIESHYRPIWKTREEAKDYLTVEGFDVYNYISVYYNQARDVHPPLFYFTVHAVSILFYSHFSKYIIFIINLTFFIASLIVIKRIMQKIDKEHLALPTIILYGLSIGGISTILFQRMYMMLTFFVLMFILINCDIIKNDFEIDRRKWIELGFVTILGFLTQYYFCIIAIIIAFCVFIGVCFKKDKKKAIEYILNYLKIALIGIAIFPLCITHMFFSYRGVAYDSLEKYKEFSDKLIDYCKLLGNAFSIPFYCIGIILIIWLVRTIVKRKEATKTNIIILTWITATIGYILAIAKTAPELDEYTHLLRYIMPIIPVVSMIIIVTIASFIPNKKFAEILLSILAGMISIYGLINYSPFFMYKGYSRYLKIAEEYKENSFVYIGANDYNHLQSMLEFATYKESLILTENDVDLLANDKKIQELDEFILSIKKYKNSDYILEQVTEKTDFKEYELLLDDDGEVACRIYKMKKVDVEDDI